jgi:hypothetical protein
MVAFLIAKTWESGYSFQLSYNERQVQVLTNLL